MWEAVVLGVALSLDAVAVAALRGLQNRKRDSHGRDAIVLPLLFGIFQSGMTFLGWIVGERGGKYVEAYDHWIAFGLLVLLGAKMAYSGFFGKDDEEEQADKSGLMVDLGLALATSIDAAAAGITLSLVPVQPGVAIGIIGIVTWVACIGGYALGKAAGKTIGARLEGIGGLLLIAIGVRVLIQHL